MKNQDDLLQVIRSWRLKGLKEDLVQALELLVKHYLQASEAWDGKAFRYALHRAGLDRSLASELESPWEFANGQNRDGFKPTLWGCLQVDAANDTMIQMANLARLCHDFYDEHGPDAEGPPSSELLEQLRLDSNKEIERLVELSGSRIQFREDRLFMPESYLDWTDFDAFVRLVAVPYRLRDSGFLGTPGRGGAHDLSAEDSSQEPLAVEPTGFPVPSLIGFSIGNVRCFDEVRVDDLRPLTVLIGENAAGKSTVLDSLYQLSHLAGDRKLPFEVRDLVRRGQEQAPLTLEVTLRAGEKQPKIRYRIALASREDRYAIVEESATLEGQGPLLVAHNGSGEVRVGETMEQFVFGPSVPALPMLQDERKHGHLVALRKAMASWEMFAVEASGLVAGGARWSQDRRTGAALGRWLLELQQGDDQGFDDVMARLRDLAPDVKNLELDADSIGELTIAVRHRDSPNKLPIDALSGGVRRMLFYEVLWRRVRGGALVLLEEPEVGLHPRWIEMIAGLLRRLSEHTQVILTTHSPGLVDRVLANGHGVDPGEILLSRRRHGAARLERPTRDQLDQFLDQFSLGEAFERGYLGA
jgi:predicted ATPase